MRSRVTISLTVRYQILGPAKTTGQGSHTPTQLEWRQLGSVGAVQSARPTSFSLPVPCRGAEQSWTLRMQCRGVLGWQGTGYMASARGTGQLASVADACVLRFLICAQEVKRVSSCAMWALAQVSWAAGLCCQCSEALRLWLAGQEGRRWTLSSATWCARVSRLVQAVQAQQHRVLLTTWGASCSSLTSMSLPNSSIEMKKGCAHSSYRNCSLSLSSLVRGRSGVSSRWHQQAITRVPPVRCSVPCSSEGCCEHLAPADNHEGATVAAHA